MIVTNCGGTGILQCLLEKYNFWSKLGFHKGLQFSWRQTCFSTNIAKGVACLHFLFFSWPRLEISSSFYDAKHTWQQWPRVDCQRVSSWKWCHVLDCKWEGPCIHEWCYLNFQPAFVMRQIGHFMVCSAPNKTFSRRLFKTKKAHTMAMRWFVNQNFIFASSHYNCII